MWQQRHQFLLGLTWFHAVVIALIGPTAGYSWELSLHALFHDGTVLHTLGEGLIIACFAALAYLRGLKRTYQATAVAFALMTASAILVHLSGGYIELHFHFFVMLSFMALYQDWVPYLLAILYVAIHHGVVGVLWPEEVFNHTAALEAPWTWAAIHAFFVLWASVGSMIAWRFNEKATAQTRMILDSAGEGIYGLDPDGTITFVNPAAARMLGLEEKYMVGKKMHEIVRHTKNDGSPFSGATTPILAPLNDGAAGHADDELFWRKDGKSFPVDYTSTPIFERGQLTGAVVTFRDVTGRKQSEQDLQLRHQELSALHGLLGPVSRTGDLAKLLDDAVAKIVEVTGTDAASIRLLDDRTGQITLAVYRGFSDTYKHAARLEMKSEGIIGQVLSAGKPLIAADLQTDRRINRGLLAGEGFRSAAYLPLKTPEKTLGIITLASRKPGHLIPQKEELLIAIARQISVTLENVRLLEETQRKNQELQSLYTISSATTQSLDLQATIHSALLNSIEVLRVDAGRLYVFDKSRNELRLTAHHGIPAADLKNYESYAPGEGIVGNIFKECQPLVISDVNTDPGYASMARTKIAAKWGFRSLIGLPITIKGRPTGVIYLYGRLVREFAAHEVQLLATIGAQIGVALERARLFEEVTQKSQQLESLVKITKDVATLLDRDVLLPRIAEEARKMLNVDGSVFRLVEGEYLVLRSASDPKTLTFRPKMRLDESVSGKIVQENRVIAIRNVFKESTIIGDHQEVLRQAGYHSFLGIPLRAKDHVIGTLNFYSKEEREFQPEEIATITAFADQAAIAIENAGLYQKSRRQEEVQKLLKEVSQDITALDSESLAQKLTEKIREFFKVDIADLKILEHGSSKSIGVSGADAKQFQAHSKGIARGRSKWIIENRQPLLIPDIAQAGGEPGGESLREAGIRGYAGIPLFGKGGAVIGFLRALTYEPRNFSQEEVDLLQQLANGAAVAIENATLYQETRRQEGIQKLVKELSQDITSLDDEALFRKLTERVREFFSVDVCDVRMINHWRPMGVTGIDPERIRGTGSKRGRSKWIIEHRRPLVIADIAKETSIPAGSSTREIGVRGYLAVPFFSRSGDVVGILRALTYQPREFSREEVDLLQQMANGTAVALENTRLYQEAQRQQEIQKLLKELSQDITALEIDSLLKKLTEKILEVLKVDISDVRVRGKEMWQVMGVSGIEPERLQSRRTGKGLWRWLLENRRPLCVPDITRDDGTYAGKTIKALGIRGYLAVPLLSRGGEVTGVLRALTYQPRNFTTEEIDLLQQLANGAALALENAKLFHETELRAREQAVLNAIAMATSQSLQLDELLRTALDKVLEVTGRDRGYIRLKDPVTGDLRLAAHRGISETYTETLLHQRTPGGKSDQVFNTGKPIVVNDPEGTLLKESTREEGLHSIAWIPLQARGNVIGILNVSTTRRVGFEDREVELLLAIGNVIGVAVENARLFQETEQQAEEQAVLNAIAMATSQSLQLDELLHTALDKVLEVTGRDRGYIRLKDPVTGNLILAAHRGISQKYIDVLMYGRRPGGKGDQVFESGEPLVINNPEDTTLKDETREEGLQCTAWIPMKAQGRTVGLLTVSASQQIPFATREVELLQAIGNVIGVAVENARLFEETKLNEDHLRRTRDHLENIFNSLDREMFWSSDPRSDTLLYVSQGTENIYGISREAFSTSPSFWKQVVHPEDAPIVEAIEQETKAGNKVKKEYRIIRPKSGEVRWVQTRIIPVLDADGKVTRIDGLLIDVTDNKEAEEALAQKAEELARSNTELQHFAYIASHDLQEPLRMVAGYTQLLAKRYKDKLDSDGKEFIHFAVDGVVRMQALINALLAYSRIGTKGKEFEPTDLQAVLDYALSNLRAAIQESGASVTHDPLPTVMGDSTQLGQLLQNLIVNAIKFRGKEPPQIHIASRQKGQEWLLSVKDNGIGIDPQYAERIFVIFQRLHNKQEYPGTGIGLALCKKIVERHGGRIWVESQPGEGATFYFTMPTQEK